MRLWESNLRAGCFALWSLLCASWRGISICIFILVAHLPKSRSSSKLLNCGSGSHASSQTCYAHRAINITWSITSLNLMSCMNLLQGFILISNGLHLLLKFIFTIHKNWIKRIWPLHRQFIYNLNADVSFLLYNSRKYEHCP